MAGVRVSATVRQPIKDIIKEYQEAEGRSESDMVSTLLEEAIAERAKKAQASK